MWRQTKNIPDGNIAYGLDFGFYPDPLALVKAAVDKGAKKIYVQEVIYKQSLSYEAVIEQMNHYVEANSMIIADTSEPRLIEALQQKGLNVHKADKGAGSVVEGIKKMLDFTIVVTADSFNIKHELRNYIWNDKKSSTPLDAENHGCDSTRYAFMRLLEGSDLLAFN